LHTDCFVRLADSLTQPADVDAVADWILPHLKGGEVLVADTGSILYLLERSRSRAGEDGIVIDVDSFESYPGSAQMQETVTRLLSEYGDDRSIIYVLSVSSTGSSVERLRHTLRPNDSILVLVDAHPSFLNTDGSDQHILTGPFTRIEVDGHWAGGGDRQAGDSTVGSPPQVGDGSNSRSADGCDRCSGSGLISVSAIGYTARTHYEWNFIRVTVNDVSDSSLFWTAVNRTNALRLHATDPAGRHRGVWIDVEALYSDDEMVNRATKELQRLDREPDLIIIPGDAASQLRSLIAADAYPEVEQVLCSKMDVSDDQAVTVANSQRPLVFPEVIVSGWTVAKMRERLATRSESAGGERNPDIDLFTLLLRPEGRRPLGRAPSGVDQLSRTEQLLVRRFRHATGVSTRYVDRVFVPGDRNCPFCVEREFLQSARRRKLSKRSLATLIGRLRSLSRPHFGYDANWENLEVDPDTHMTLGSFFGELSSSCAFAAASAAAEGVMLRLRDSHDGRAIDVLDTPMIIQAFYDHVLLYGILRSFPSGLVNGPGLESAITEVVHSWALREIPLASCQEVAYAVAAGKLPKALIPMIASAASGDPYVDLMIDLALG
jgi:hypothetical protein